VDCNICKHFWKYVKSKTKSKEPIGDLIYTNDIGDKITATKDDNKAEVLWDFFSSVFCLEKDGDFPALNNKQCDTVSEIPSFDLEDIIKRLKKLNVNKSPGPDRIHPKILYETADQIAYP